MKHLIFIFLFVIAALSASAKDNFVEGQILNDNKPVRNVVVKVSSLSKTTTTDKRGNFKIRNISSGRDTLFIELSAERTLKIALDGDNHFKIALRNDSIFIERDKIEVFHPAYGGTIISRKEMEQTGENNLLRAICSRVAGVQYLDNNLLIRGPISILGRNTPLYVINGMYSYDASYLNVWDIETVEVVKGPSAAMFGSEGAAGVVVIRLREKN